MPCILALIILAFFSIFSVKYRPLAKEAFNCVFRRITLRPCKTEFNIKIKTLISSWFLKRNEKLGGFVFRRFEILSWIFVILFLVSGFFSMRSVYFYVRFGSCNPAEPQNCVINQLTSPSNTNVATTTCDEAGKSK